MSTHPVLSISELLNHIFLAAPDPEPSDILKLALVSKCWSEVALPLLWSHPVHHEMWMSGHELERVGSVCKLELLVSLFPTILPYSEDEVNSLSLTEVS